MLKKGLIFTFLLAASYLLTSETSKQYQVLEINFHGKPNTQIIKLKNPMTYKEVIKSLSEQGISFIRIQDQQDGIFRAYFATYDKEEDSGTEYDIESGSETDN